MNNAFIDLMRLCAHYGKVPETIPVHYLEYVRSLHRTAKCRPRCEFLNLPSRIIAGNHARY